MAQYLAENSTYESQSATMSDSSKPFPEGITGKEGGENNPEMTIEDQDLFAEDLSVF